MGPWFSWTLVTSGLQFGKDDPPPRTAAAWTPENWAPTNDISARSLLTPVGQRLGGGSTQHRFMYMLLLHMVSFSDRCTLNAQSNVIYTICTHTHISLYTDITVGRVSGRIDFKSENNKKNYFRSKRDHVT